MKLFRNKIDYQKSYSQTGEDLIVNRILNRLKISNPYYLDLGGYHPHIMSNTYHFYEKGSNGLIVEANPNLIPAFKKYRPKDKVENIGVCGIDGDGMSLKFYEFENQTVSTFSEVEKNKLLYKGEKLLTEHLITMYTLNQIINQFCKKKPHFVSIDLEGIDLEVLQSYNFDTYMPLVFCIETAQMPEDTKNQKIIDLMNSKGYLLLADTYINSIFVVEGVWKNRFL